METRTLYEEWLEARTRFFNQLAKIRPEDLTKRLGDSPNSVGFLFRHIAEVELLFSKNVFGLKDVQVVAKTVIEQKDSGVWTDLEELQSIERQAFSDLERAILSQDDSSWGEVVHTKEFGSKTKAEALGRIISHTAYHAGQMALIVKYGK